MFDEEKIEEMRTRLKESLDDNARCYEGELERMRERTDKLEDIVIHLVCFLADHLDLNDAETESCLLDW